MSLLDVETKILSKGLGKRIKKYLPIFVSANQTAYADGRVISEGGRLISDILQKGNLMEVDTQQAFDSVGHIFQLSALEKYGFVQKYCRMDRRFTKRPRIVHYKWWNNNTIF